MYLVRRRDRAEKAPPARTSTLEQTWGIAIAAIDSALGRWLGPLQRERITSHEGNVFLSQATRLGVSRSEARTEMHTLDDLFGIAESRAQPRAAASH